MDSFTNKNKFIIRRLAFIGFNLARRLVELGHIYLCKQPERSNNIVSTKNIEKECEHEYPINV